jgi:membrane-bound lytic murein transglycosylase B
MKIILSTLSLLVLVTVSLSSTAQPQKNWPLFIKEIRAEAIGQGIKPKILDLAFKGIKQPNRKVIKFDRTQPETRLTFLKYRNTRASAFRIKIGIGKLKKYHDIISHISEKYGVSECFIVSLWGLETAYGNFMGSFPVIHSLATLAFDNRRSKFFRKQLFYALHILNDGHVALKDFKGEWAGASGHPQFLPSSWHHYAVDHDNDGRKDIWRTLPDAFASIANYLKENGWKTNQPWAIRVTLPPDFNIKNMGRKIKKSVTEWENLGVKSADDELPTENYQASIVEPYGGPTYMIFNNFNVIMRWNRSIYYAGTVGYMAEQVCQRPIR